MLADFCKVLASCASSLDIMFVMQTLFLWHEVIDELHVHAKHISFCSDVFMKADTAASCH